MQKGEFMSDDLLDEVRALTSTSSPVSSEGEGKTQ
jgi:hypothetical protein